MSAADGVDVSLAGRTSPGWSPDAPRNQADRADPHRNPVASARGGREGRANLRRVRPRLHRRLIGAAGGQPRTRPPEGACGPPRPIRGRRLRAPHPVQERACRAPGQPCHRQARRRPRPRAVRRQRLGGKRGRDEGGPHVLGGARPTGQAPVRVRLRQLSRQHRRRSRSVRPAPVRRPLPRAGPAGRADHRPSDLPAARSGGQHRRGRVHRQAPRRVRPPRRPPHRRRPARGDRRVRQRRARPAAGLPRRAPPAVRRQRHPLDLR